MNEPKLRELITLFLCINPEPSDEQFHALACAVGIDHETLESISYAMLSEAEHGQELLADSDGEEVYANDAPGEEDLSDAQGVLDGDYDPNVTKTDDLMLNDGLPAGEDSTALLQDTALNDGVSSGDMGAGIADQSLLYSDGLAPMKLGASARLGMVLAAKEPIELVMTKATHLNKAKETPASIIKQDDYKGLVIYVLDIEGKKLFGMSAGSGSDKVGDAVTWKHASGKIENLITPGSGGKPKGKNNIGMDEARPVYSFK